MAGTLSEIRSGLGDALRAIPGVMVAEHIPEQITPPLAVVMLNRVDFHRAMRGGDTPWQFIVVLLAGRMGEKTGQMRLDDYLSWDGTQSVRAALEADQSLGGAADTCTVQAARAIQPFQVGDAAYFGVEFEVEVHA